MNPLTGNICEVGHLEDFIEVVGELEKVLEIWVLLCFVLLLDNKSTQPHQEELHEAQLSHVTELIWLA